MLARICRESRSYDGEIHNGHTSQNICMKVSIFMYIYTHSAMLRRRRFISQVPNRKGFLQHTKLCVMLAILCTDGSVFAATCLSVFAHGVFNDHVGS